MASFLFWLDEVIISFLRLWHLDENRSYAQPTNTNLNITARTNPYRTNPQSTSKAFVFLKSNTISKMCKPERDIRHILETELG